MIVISEILRSQWDATEKICIPVSCNSHELVPIMIYNMNFVGW